MIISSKFSYVRLTFQYMGEAIEVSGAVRAATKAGEPVVSTATTTAIGAAPGREVVGTGATTGAVLPAVTGLVESAGKNLQHLQIWVEL